MTALHLDEFAARPPPRLPAMAALPSAAMRRAVLGEAILRSEPGEAAALIEAILRGAAQGRPEAQEAVLELASWIIEARAPASLAADPGRPRRACAIAAIREAAVSTGRSAVAAILAEGPAGRAISPHGRLAEVCLDVEAPFHWYPHLPICAGANLHLLERLRAHPDDQMIRRLLQQRWLRAKDVYFIASRRPSSAAITLAVAQAPRWMQLVEVREALAENPFTPVGVAAPLVPTLRLRAMRRLRDRGDAHPSVEAAAREVLALRASLSP